MRRALLLVCLLPALVLAGCGGDDDDAGSTTTLAADTTATETSGSTTTTDTGTGTVGCVEAEAPTLEERTEDQPSTALDESTVYQVTFDTNCGSFTIRLDQAQSPEAAASFYALAENGYFDDTIFHRIVPGFVIQGGDPTGTGGGGPGYSTVDTPPPDASYRHGTVAMAKAGDEPPGAAGSQFFVVTAPDAGLPPDYAVIGTVTDGLEVVDAIGQLGGPDEQPTQVVLIEKATASTA
jgi:cyclophilin family peptidyl-prolyl cis-trans isomerase